MLRDKRRKAGNRHPPFGIALAVLVVIAGSYALEIGRKSASTAETVRTVGRLVVVVGSTLPSVPKVAERNCLRSPDCHNGTGGTVLVQLVQGAVPASVQPGRVLTDQSCTPDKYGISHCLNQVELADGKMLVVRHNHSMMTDPCLRPGEQVRVEPLKLFVQT